MNILYYDGHSIKIPEIIDSENSDEDHFISIGVDNQFKNGHMIDIYVSLFTDLSHRINININEQ